MKTFEFIIKTPGGELISYNTSNESYWEAKKEAEEQGEIISESLIKY